MTKMVDKLLQVAKRILKHLAPGLKVRHLIYIALATHAFIFTVQFVSTFIPKAPLRTKIKDAFTLGYLQAEDFPTDRYGLKLDMYTECQIMQMLINHDESRLAEAVTPSYWMRGAGYCATLNRIAQPDPPTGRNMRKHRYWYGVKPYWQVLLSVADVATSQVILVGINIAVILLFAFVAFRVNHPLGWTLLPVALCALAFGSNFSLGKLASQSVGYVFTFLAASMMIVNAPRMRGRSQFLLYGFAVGCLTWYIDLYLAIPMNGGLHFLLGFLIARVVQRSLPAACLLAGVATFSGWLIGFAVGVVGKQLAAAALFGPKVVFGKFFDQFIFRLGAVEGAETTAIEALAALVRDMNTMTFGSTHGATLLGIAATSGWLAMLACCFRSLRSQREITSRIYDGMAMLATAIIVLGWFAFFSNLTVNHSYLLSRYLLLVIALPGVFFVLTRLEKLPSPVDIKVD